MPYLAIIIFVCLSACSSNANKPTDSKPVYEPINAHYFSIDGKQNVSFSGYVNFDEFQKLNTINGPIYSGYNAASFFVSVLAHAVVSKSADSAIMHAFIDDSNEQALNGLNDIIANYKTDELILQLESTINNSNQYATPFVTHLEDNQIPKTYIYSKPEFIITKEQDMIILENVFAILNKPKNQVETLNSKSRNKRNKKSTAQTKTVVYLSDKIEGQNATLTADNGSLLKNITAELFVNSVKLFDQQFKIKKKPQGNMKTIKFHIGDHFRVERGKVLLRTCDRVTFVTLRGWVKSVPQESDCLID